MKEKAVYENFFSSTIFCFWIGIYSTLISRSRLTLKIGFSIWTCCSVFTYTALLSLKILVSIKAGSGSQSGLIQTGLLWWLRNFQFSYSNSISQFRYFSKIGLLKFLNNCSILKTSFFSYSRKVNISSIIWSTNLSFNSMIYLSLNFS